MAQLNVTAHGRTLVLNASTSSDADGDLLLARWIVDNATLLPRSLLATFDASYTGKYSIVVMVTDTSGAAGHANVTYLLEGPFDPVASLVAPSEGRVGDAIILDAGSSYDPDRSPLTFRWLLNDTWSLGNLSTFEFRIPSYGEHRITVKVQDADGATAQRTMTINGHADPPSFGEAAVHLGVGATLLAIAALVLTRHRRAP